MCLICPPPRLAYSLCLLRILIKSYFYRQPGEPDVFQTAAPFLRDLPGGVKFEYTCKVFPFFIL